MVIGFQSSFELTGYITNLIINDRKDIIRFQSSFELTGYITQVVPTKDDLIEEVSKLFRAYRLYNLCSLEGA